MTEEKRHYQRIAFDAEVVLKHDGESLNCNLVDISLKSLLVVFPHNIKPLMGELYELELRLGVDATIQMQVRVVRLQEHLVGLEWNNINVDSMTHLRRLLELNEVSGEEMQRELSELG